MNEMKWGVLSTGRIAEQFARDMQAVSGATILGATSRTLKNAKAYAQRHGLPKVYSDTNEMLGDPHIDAIYIATPHTLHVQNTLDAIAAGKHVLCEKPIAISPAELTGLIDTARASSVYVMEAMWTWFLPAIRMATQWVNEGRIGKLVQIKADFGYPQRPYSPEMRVYNKDLGGGCMLDMGIYPVALLWHFLRRDPLSIQAVGRHAPNGVEDDVAVLLDYGDCTATIATSFRTKLNNWAYLIGEDGYITIPDFWCARECLLYEIDTLREHFKDKRTTIGLNFETQAMIDDIRNGKTESDVVTLDDSMQFQRTIERILQAL